MKTTTPYALQRRDCLALGVASLVAPLAAHAEVLNIKEPQLRAMQLRPDGIVMDLPNVADSSASVPLQVTIQPPAGLLVQMVDVYVPENPLTLALKLRLPEAAPHFAFATRLRLAGSQRVWVVATLSDGSVRGTSAAIEVISSSCFDAS
jgi:predicted secreted protein